MITIKEIYDNYPSSDLLPIEVTDETRLEDIEAEADEVGDTLFLFLCRELCNENDPLTREEARSRCANAIHDISCIRQGLFQP